MPDNLSVRSLFYLNNNSVIPIYLLNERYRPLSFSHNLFISVRGAKYILDKIVFFCSNCWMMVHGMIYEVAHT